MPALQSALLRRAKPLLGTLVEVACQAADAAVTLHANEQAFKAIAAVHQGMSRHECGSELSALNRLAPGVWLNVSQAMLDVLLFAQTLSAQTGGIFDVFTTCADASPDGSWRDLEMDLPNHRLRKHAPLKADLGGLGKGYAVDVAVQALQSAGAHQGWVNAGGDLRVFGSSSLRVQVRAPWNTSQCLDCTTLQNRAAATSASYWLETPVLRHGVTRSAVEATASFTVVAATCMAADALTKVLAVADGTENPLQKCSLMALLDRWGAQTWVFRVPAATMSAHA